MQLNVNGVNNKERLFHPWPAVCARCACTKIRHALGPVCILPWSSAFSVQPFWCVRQLFSVLYSAWAYHKCCDSVYKRFLVISMGERRTSRSRNSSIAAMLESHGDSSVSSPSNTSSLPRSATATSSSSFTLSQQDLAAAFSQALGESLPQILVAMQTHSTMTASASAVSPLAGNVTPLSTSSNTGSTSSHSSSPAGHSSGSILSVPSFISTYCTLGNSSLCNPSIVGAPSSCGAGGAMSGTLAISGGHGSSFPLLGSSIPATSTICVVPSLNRPFVVGPGHSPIPEKLVTKIRTGKFVDLADLLAENLKAQESEPHTYLDGKLLVSSSKKRVQEITDIITWVEAFTIFSWIFCSAHPSRWQDPTQYKLLIIKTSRQFPGKPGFTMTLPFVGMQQHLV